MDFNWVPSPSLAPRRAAPGKIETSGFHNSSWHPGEASSVLETQSRARFADRLGRPASLVNDLGEGEVMTFLRRRLRCSDVREWVC